MILCYISHTQNITLYITWCLIRTRVFKQLISHIPHRSWGDVSGVSSYDKFGCTMQPHDYITYNALLQASSWSEKWVEANIWMDWCVWPLILEKDVKCVLCQSNCLDTIVEVRGTLSVVRAACVHHAHRMAYPQQCGGFHIVRGTLGGVFGVVSFQRCEKKKKKKILWYLSCCLKSYRLFFVLNSISFCGYD